jgi:DNA-binding protein H-NS
MNKDDLEEMSLDDLWGLHERITAVLAKRIELETSKLQARLDRLARNFADPAREGRQPRPYPKVRPKFQNPDQPTETWAGRGKQPRWVSDLLKAGKSIEDLRI